MSSYKAPHASVQQEFVTSPGGVAAESLPSAVIGTAYDVYTKKSLGSTYGIMASRVMAWGVDKVVSLESVIGTSGYNFYKPKVYANTVFGQIALDVSAETSSTGVTITRDTTYQIPGTERALGSCSAIIPYYKYYSSNSDLNGVAGDAHLLVGKSGVVNFLGLKAGQPVYILDNAGAYVSDLGVLTSDATDPSWIHVSGTVAATTYAGVSVGADKVTTNLATTIYDSTANFINNGVKVGDIVTFTSNAVSGIQTASVEQVVSATTLKIAAASTATDAASVDSNYARYKLSSVTPGSTINLSSYSVNRLLGFAENYKYSSNGTQSNTQVTKVSTTSLTFPSTGNILPMKGDIATVVTARPVAQADYTTGYVYHQFVIDTVSLAGSVVTITSQTPIYKSNTESATPFTNDDYISIWHPKTQVDVVADFRAVNTSELGVVKKISSISDIKTAWANGGDIDPHNDLAFMASACFASAGGKVIYGVNVDSTSPQTTAYAEAMEALKMHDVYSHAFGTTDAGVNALVPAYCDEQSEPYEGHERIGVLTYDKDSVYTIGSSTGTIASTGIITLTSAFNAMTAGVMIGDTVEMYNNSMVLQCTYKVTATPEASSAVSTNAPTTITVTAPTIFKFIAANKDIQASKIAALSLGNRRVSIVWPGWFTGTVNGVEMTLPPYYISAAIAGKDGAEKPSQSFTNLPFSVPGVSGISLDTNFYFRKAQLDVIAGAGINIMIQNVSRTDVIKSRHDLTTNMDAVQLRERSITKQADVAAKTLRAAVAPYVGRYNITPQLFAFLGKVCSIVANVMKNDGVLARMDINSITRDELIDDKINFDVTAIAFIAGNYYDVKLLVKTR